jgi:archaellum component FlaC
MSVDTQVHADIMRSLGRIEGTVQGILDQATKTNDRVNGLEKAVTEMKVTDGITATKLSLIGALSGAVGGFILSLLKITFDK